MMKSKKLIFLFLFLIVIIVISGCSDNGKKYESFAKCLTEKNVTMYGTEWCSHCKAQKRDFGSSFEYVNFVDCDKQMNLCLANKVKVYPTWIIDGEIIAGDQNLEYLSELSGCEINYTGP